jgi:hypothetical protein
MNEYQLDQLDIEYSNTIKLSSMDLDDLDDDLIDEDSLLHSYNLLMSGLTTPGLTPGLTPGDQKDCKTSRNACKNCVCGRDGSGSKSNISMCGNCHLGDGFRCDRCPSKGLPPFNPGDKVRINDDPE